MRIFMYRKSFKIRSKADAEKLLNMGTDPDFGRCEQEFYWHDEKNDYYIDPKRCEVFSRPLFCRGNIFNPYCQEVNAVDTIWKTRKCINAQHFPAERT